MGAPATIDILDNNILNLSIIVDVTVIAARSGAKRLPDCFFTALYSGLFVLFCHSQRDSFLNQLTMRALFAEA